MSPLYLNGQHVLGGDINVLSLIFLLLTILPDDLCPSQVHTIDFFLKINIKHNLLSTHNCTYTFLYDINYSLLCPEPALSQLDQLLPIGPRAGVI